MKYDSSLSSVIAPTPFAVGQPVVHQHSPEYFLRVIGIRINKIYFRHDIEIMYRNGRTAVFPDYDLIPLVIHNKAIKRQIFEGRLNNAKPIVTIQGK